MRNEILIPSAVVPNAYFLRPMGDSDPSDFIHQKTNQIPFKQSVVDSSCWNKNLSETSLTHLRDGEIGSVGYLRRKEETRSFMT